MKAICAWCESEGRPSDLGEREPFYNPAVTHCICAYHQKRLLELLPSKSFPDAEVLIVVRPNDTALHDHLQRSFAGMRAVKVIMERRAGDRRAAQTPVADERRHRRMRRIRQGPGFFARLHRCAIHAESHSAPERRYSTKADGAGGGPAHTGLVPSTPRPDPEMGRPSHPRASPTAPLEPDVYTPWGYDNEVSIAPYLPRVTGSD